MEQLSFLFNEAEVFAEVSTKQEEAVVVAAHKRHKKHEYTLDNIPEGIPTKQVEHRLETVLVKDGVTYINDSKATNVDSAWYALDSMTAPVVWIAGGKDKGNDYSVLYELVRKKVKALVCMGLHNEKLIESFSPFCKVVDTDNLEDAVKAARNCAEPGDVVLLSPCCASFDLFRSYEHRGEMFKQEVRK